MSVTGTVTCQSCRIRVGAVYTDSTAVLRGGKSGVDSWVKDARVCEGRYQWAPRYKYIDDEERSGLGCRREGDTTDTERLEVGVCNPL